MRYNLKTFSLEPTINLRHFEQIISERLFFSAETIMFVKRRMFQRRNQTFPLQTWSFISRVNSDMYLNGEERKGSKLIDTIFFFITYPFSKLYVHLYFTVHYMISPGAMLKSRKSKLQNINSENKNYETFYRQKKKEKESKFYFLSNHWLITRTNCHFACFVGQCKR